MNMNLNEYQEKAYRTAKKFETHSAALSDGGLGISGEAGELANKIKKHIHHNHPLDPDALVEEIGDVLWYAAFLASTLGETLEEIAQFNIAKLKLRYPDGFSTKASIDRKDVK
jgi:NTP pyrophosphatase (non-canonical NTP hydrolase)